MTRHHLGQSAGAWHVSKLSARGCVCATLALGCAVLSEAHASAPGLGDEVYPATVEKGAPEFGVQWDRLAGGTDDGEDVLELEASYGVTDRLRITGFADFAKELGQSRDAEAIGVEAIYALGNVGGIDFALFGAYEAGLHGPDEIESQLLVERRSGPWDMRLNLVAAKELTRGELVELGYAAAVDVEASDEFRVGVQAFGELGTFKHFLPRAEHFVGPVAAIELEGLGPELEIEAGYLFALGAARDDTDGQIRLALDFKF
jgi:hypothetical protein